jgi:hypothetical protein
MGRPPPAGCRRCGASRTGRRETGGARGPSPPQERLQPSEWAAAATAGLGVLLLGASSEPEHAPVAAPAAAAAAAAAGAPAPGGLAAGGHSAQPREPPRGGAEAPAAIPPPGPPGPTASSGGSGGGGPPAGAQAGALAAAAHQAGPSAARVLLTFVLLVALLALEVWWRQRRHKRVRRGGGAGHGHGHASAHARGAEEAADAAACGLEAGACFGFSAAACRTGFQLAPSLGWPLVPAGLAASVALTSSGFVLQVRAPTAGRRAPVGRRSERERLRAAPPPAVLGCPPAAALGP